MRQSGASFIIAVSPAKFFSPNAPGRDPVITRIIWLRGLEASNAHAFSRCIYIHGTPEEKKIGRPASYGCIRMKSNDVTALYSQLPVGAHGQNRARSDCRKCRRRRQSSSSKAGRSGGSGPATGCRGEIICSSHAWSEERSFRGQAASEEHVGVFASEVSRLEPTLS